MIQICWFFFCISNMRENMMFSLLQSPKKNSKARIWDVKDVKERLGSFICKHILFIHAMLGCDSTSRVFGLGKGVLLKKIRSNPHLQQYANVFSSRQSTNEDIKKAGEQTLVILYGGKKNDDLNFLRHKKFCEKVASNVASIEPQTLPPTSAAMKYHSYRVYYQICVWNEWDSEMLPEDWGWRINEEGFVPVATDLPVAPENLLKVVRCSCKTDCNSLRCSCRKHNLKCTIACTHCRGSDCRNVIDAGVSIDDDTDEEIR